MQVFIIIIFYTYSIFSNNELDSLLIELEDVMNKREIYDKKKEKRIKNLLEKSTKTANLEEIYRLYIKIYKEYEFYSFNNALKYIEKNIQIAEKLNNSLYLNEAKLKMALLLIDTGRYKESIDVLNEIQRNSLSESLINDYLIAYKEGYSGLAYNTSVNSSRLNYSKLYTSYQDSLYSRLKPNSEEVLRLKEKQYRDSRNLEMAFKINSLRLEKVSMGSREYSLVTFERSLLYELNKEIAKQKEYLILSAISDIKASVKDNASMGTLAKIFFTEGAIERAHRYINFSYEDAIFYNSQLRYVDIANNMPIITKAYEQKSLKQKRKLKYSLVFISILSCFLLIAVYSIFRQIKKVSFARNKLKKANEKLKEYNLKLNKSNEDLKQLYLELSEVDKIKEHCIGTFLNLYSEYIGKLDTYRKLVSKYVKANKMNSLIKLSKSKQLIDEELQIFNKNFDTSFLHIYPDFIKSVNKLLKPDKQLVTESSTQLNTKLRIVALIKLGIVNSSQIAKVLRYSANTIYNYRAEIKNASIDKATFEDMLKKI